MNMKNTLTLLLSGVVLVAFSTTGYCRDRIKIVGSSTVYPFSTVVAEKFGQKDGYKTPIVESTGTGGGMKLFCAGIGESHPDITNASRAMKASEWEMCQKNGVSEVVEIIVGNDGIAFANSAKGKKINLTRAQLWKAMAAKGPKPQKWSEIDSSFPDSRIEIMVPPPTSGTRDAWNALVMSKGCDSSVKAANKKDCELMREDGRVIEAGENDNLIIQKLDANPSAFGIFGFSYLENNRNKIQAMTIEGKEISLDSVQDYSYPVSRPLYFYAKKAHVGAIPGVQEFLNEFTSIAAVGDDGYLADIGLVPLEESKLQQVRKAATTLTPMKGIS